MQALQEAGFTRSQYDHSLFIKSSDRVYVAVYVDDLLIFGPEISRIQSLKDHLARKFRMTDMGPISTYLGMDISRDLDAKTLTISQFKYVRKILADHGLENCSSVSTPMDPGLILTPADPSFIPTPEEHQAYRSGTGSLNYLATISRPDIAYAVSKLSQFNNRPTPEHYQAVKRVMRYLKGTSSLAITYGNNKDSVKLQGFSDASYGDDLHDRRSMTGYLFMLNHGPISWHSRKQATVAKSTYKAEYMAQNDAAFEAI